MHVITQHEDSAIITIVGNQQHLLSEAMETFKQDMKVVLNSVIQGQNMMNNRLKLLKEEIVLLKQSRPKWKDDNAEIEKKEAMNTAENKEIK